MALRCLALIFACVALAVDGNRVEIGNKHEASVGKVLENVSGNGGIKVDSERVVLTGSGDVDKSEREGKRVYIPVVSEGDDLLNRSHPAITRLRRVEASMDFRPQKTFLEMASEMQDFSVKNIADPKSWVWDQLEQAYGFMNELVSEPSDLDEGRAKKKKKKILYFLIKLVIGLKVLLMGVLLPGVLTFTTLLSWKAVTISILAFAFAKLGALKSMLKGFGDGGEKAPSHHFVISPPSHWEKRSHHTPTPVEHPTAGWHVDPSHHSNPYRRSYPQKP